MTFENIALGAFGAFCLLSGIAILGKQEKWVRYLQLQSASQSPFIGLMGLVLGALLIAVLIMRIA